MAHAAPILPADDEAARARAASILKAGGLVALPTETVYGLAADASDGEAVARIFEAKGRPRFNPLIAHVDGLARAESLVELGPLGTALARRFWPGPLTLVARRRAGGAASDLAAAGLETLAVRWPDAPALSDLVTRIDAPLAAPSANRSGAISPTTAAHVAEGLGARIDLILDGGPCRVGVESSIVDVSGPSARLLRPGGLPRADIEAVTGPLLAPEPGAGVSAPGMLTSHYAPRARLRLDAAAPEPGEAFLAFGADVPQSEGPVANLSPSGDLAEAAATLFARLRALDAAADRIAVARIPDEGLGEAINDRLRRAAAPREA